MSSTAIIVDRGHRIGVRLASISYPAFSIHPNTWEAIDSYEQAKTAFNTLYLSCEVRIEDYFADRRTGGQSTV